MFLLAGVQVIEKKLRIDKVCETHVCKVCSVCVVYAQKVEVNVIINVNFVN